MHLVNLFSSRTRWKCFVYCIFAAVCFAQTGPGTRGGPAGFSSQLRNATVNANSTTNIKYVQGNYATPQTPQTTVSVTYTGAQAAADLNVVVVGWNDSTAVVNTVTDKSGNTYTRAVGPTVRRGSLSQSIYYAKNIAAAAAGANTVTVTFSVAAQSADIRIVEYSGADLNSPVDVTVARTGSSTTSNSGSVTTTNPTDLLFAANIVATYTVSPGKGFMSRMVTSPDGDIIEDRMTTAAGSHSATATLGSAGPWIMQMVALRTPALGGDPPPPTAPSNLTATVSGSQINLNWTASTDNVGVTGYLVQRCPGAGCTTFAQIATTTATTYSDTGLTPGSYSYRVRATDAAGNLSPYSNVASATIPAAPGPPVITSTTTASGRVGAPFSYQITATNAPTSYGAAGLPAGLSVNTGTGLISGTPTSAGTLTVTLSATNGAGIGNATLTLTIAAAPPVITSTTTASGRLGAAFSYQITATNAPTSYGATGLPAGLSVNTGNGLISGTPTSAGTSTVTLNATNGAGTGNATLTLTIAAATPVITSATTASGRVGSAFSYQITATNTPTSYGATGLPAGLSVNTGTGLISGTPTSAATSTVTLSATNSAGTGNATLTLTIAAASPVITSATTASGRVGSAFSYQITATNTPTSYGATGLPAGLSVTTGTGLISGTPTSALTSTVTLSATNSAGTGNATLTLTIAAAPPVITSATTAIGRVGSAFSYQITATNTPTSYGATGLPAGLSVNTGTGLISGTPTSASTSTVTLSATNGAGTGNATLTLTIAAAAPAITSGTTASGKVGSAFSYQITATNAPTSYGATGLPAGLSVNTGTGLISGTPTSAATATVTLSATNSAGTGNATLTLTVTSTGLLSMTPSSTNFGNVAMGSDSIQSVVLSNTSASSITISQANVAGNEFSITGLSLPLTLAANQNSTFSVAFTPSSTGTVPGSVSLVSTATNSPTTETLSGTGIHVVDLSWQASTSTVAGYNVYRGTVSGGPYTKVNSSLISGTDYMDASVQAGQTYYYVATAVDSSNDESAYSTQTPAVVPSP